MNIVDLVCVKKGIMTKELNCFKGISAEKEFEMSVIELVDYGYIIVYIYRSPDNKLWTFFLNTTISNSDSTSKKDNVSYVC